MEQTALNYLFAAVGCLMGWILKVVWDSVQALKGDVQTIERNLPNVYVRRDDTNPAHRPGYWRKRQPQCAAVYRNLLDGMTRATDC